MFESDLGLTLIRGKICLFLEFCKVSLHEVCK